MRREGVRGVKSSDAAGAFSPVAPVTRSCRGAGVVLPLARVQKTKRQGPALRMKDVPTPSDERKERVCRCRPARCAPTDKSPGEKRRHLSTGTYQGSPSSSFISLTGDGPKDAPQSLFHTSSGDVFLPFPPFPSRSRDACNDMREPGAWIASDRTDTESTEELPRSGGPTSSRKRPTQPT